MQLFNYDHFFYLCCSVPLTTSHTHRNGHEFNDYYKMNTLHHVKSLFDSISEYHTGKQEFSKI